jgi:lipoprotein-releasing system permease protein
VNHKASPFRPPPQALESVLRYGFVGALVLAVLVGIFVVLARRFTIFTTISTFGLFLGSAALVIVLSVMSGFEQDLKHKILGANAHVLVTVPEGSFVAYEKPAAAVRQVKGVESVTPYLSNEVMISSQSNLAGVVLKGIDPATAEAVTDLSKQMEQGSLDNLVHPEKLLEVAGPRELLDDDEEDDPAPPKSDKGDKGAKKKTVFAPVDSHGKVLPAPPPRAARKVLPGVIIGRELAKNLRLFLGDDVNIISPMGDIGPTGPIPRSRSFRIAGIFYSGMYEYDSKSIYMTIPAAQKFLVMKDEITGLEVRIADPEHSERTAAAIERALAGEPTKYEVQDWKELNRNLFSALKVEKVAMFVVLCFVILVAGFSIIANGIMLVREKEREIAILKSMGAPDRTVLRTFLFMGLSMGAIGIGVGIAVGILSCVLLARYGIALDTDVYYIAKLPVQMNPYEIAAVCAAAMGIALAATLYPALVAARLRPVDGLRYDHA